MSRGLGDVYKRQCEMRVSDGKYEEKDCTAWEKIPQNGKILTYRIHANVFECGTR